MMSYWLTNLVIQLIKHHPLIISSSFFSFHLIILFSSPGQAISTIKISFFSRSSYLKSGLAVKYILIRCSQSHIIFFPLFPITRPFPHLFLQYILSIQYILSFPIQLPLSLTRCRVFERALLKLTFLHPAKRCCTVSFLCLHNFLLSLLLLLSFPLVGKVSRKTLTEIRV